MSEKAITNKMGVQPIGGLILKMGVPMILSMMLQAFYNIVDSYFVSNMEGVGDAAVNALTLAFPIQALMVAIGIGTGVGVNSLLSRYLGMGDKEKASRIAGNAIFLSICTYILFLIFGLFFVDAYISSQTADPLIREMGNSYLSICCIYSFGSVIYMIYEKLIQGTGKTVLSTIAQISGALTNIVLDPIMIFGLLGCPEMGIEGAAIATVIGQVVSLILGMIFHHTKNKEIDTSFAYLLPDRRIIADIYRVGVPAIIMQALMSVMTYCVNIIFVRISGSVVTAYGIYFKIQQFVFFAAFGLNNAIIPIVAFNYGMKDKDRIKRAIRCGMIYNAVIMLIGAVLLAAFRRSYNRAFRRFRRGAGSEHARHTYHYLRICFRRRQRHFPGSVPGSWRGLQVPHHIVRASFDRRHSFGDLPHHASRSRKLCVDRLPHRRGLRPCRFGNLS